MGPYGNPVRRRPGLGPLLPHDTALWFPGIPVQPLLGLHSGAAQALRLDLIASFSQKGGFSSSPSGDGGGI